MECKKKKSGHEEQRVVIPVFYRVDPSHVRKQSVSYHTALAKHKRTFKSYHEIVHKWNDALFQAANLAGFDSRIYRCEVDLIEEIVETILPKLNIKNYKNEVGCPFIRDQNFACVESLLRSESNKVLVIGIWGMAGIGKITIAATLFNEFSSQYDGCCFLAIAREIENQSSNHIYSRLLSQLLKQDLHIDNLQVIACSVIRKLKRKKVFIVLDDVNNSQIAADLVGLMRNCLRADSRVILTTKDRNVLTSGGIEIIHEVKKKNYSDSLKLFSLNAFNDSSPKEGYNELSARVATYARGIPLALKILGLFLRSKRKNEWNSALNKLMKYPHADIQKVLRLSFDGLDDEEKSILLDIACFLEGHKRSKVIKILNSCDFCADIGIRSLLDKALITIDSDDCIKIHDLIQKMCQKIVHEESSKNGGVPTRLWDTQEACNVLKSIKGIDAVESIIVDMNQITIDPRVIIHAFRKMAKLRLLALEGSINKDIEWSRTNDSVLLSRGFKGPNNLRYFMWIGCPFMSLSFSSWPQKLLVLSMPDSHIQKLWDSNVVQNLPSLETIDLTGCSNLIECPNLSGAPNLKHVKLYGCESLPCIHSSIFSLPRLEELNVSHCKAIRSLKSNYCSPYLQSLYAYGCSNLEEFSVPMAGHHLESQLYLTSTALSEVPSTIMHLNNIRDFSFPISYSLEKLPENFAETIMLSDSKKLEDDTYIILSRIMMAPAFLSLSHLLFFECESFSELPDNISELRSLQVLTLWESHVIGLPKSIKYLQQLIFLEVILCKKFQYVPPLPPSIQFFYCRDCISLKTISSLTSKPPKEIKATFAFHNCTSLDQHAYDAILEDFNFRVEHRTTTASKDDGCPNDINNDNICYYLPSKDIIFDWFPYYSTQTSITIKVHPDPKAISGLVFYMLLSQYQSCNLGQRVIFKCECYLETSCDEWVYITSSFNKEWLVHPYGITPDGIMSDHVLLWYDAKCCKKIIEAVKETMSGTTYNPNLIFEFYAQTEDGEELVLEECGILWRYIDIENGRENREGYEYEESQEAVSPNKTKCL